MNCDYCSHPLTGTYVMDLWGHQYHEHHIKKAIRCISCTAHIMPTKGSMKLEDGNRICSNCLPEVILKKWQMEKCIQAVFEFYALGKINFPKKRIKFELVLEKDLPDNAMGQYIFCNNEFTVKILKGLAKPLFCGVAAHELMHVYLRECNHDFTLVEEEGLCEVMRYFVLKKIDDRLSRAAIRIMEQSKDPIYCKGYWLMRNKIIENGGRVQNFLTNDIIKRCKSKQTSLKEKLASLTLCQLVVTLNHSNN